MFLHHLSAGHLDISSLSDTYQASPGKYQNINNVNMTKIISLILKIWLAAGR